MIGFFHNFSVGAAFLVLKLLKFLVFLKRVYAGGNPNAMQQDGEFACDSGNGATATLCAHQSHAPRFDLSPHHRSHEECICGSIKRCAHILIPSF